MKLLNLNIGIKEDNTTKVAKYLLKQDADIIILQEVARHLEDGVLEKFKSKAGLEEIISEHYPYSYFGPLWKAKAFQTKGKIHTEFGGHIEQGNQIYSKFPILSTTNEYYYGTYSNITDWTDWEQKDHGRAMQMVELNVDGKTLQVLNLHGIWTKHKTGDERTLAQCEYIAKAAKRKNIPTIIAGDLNLHPSSESIKILDKEFRNLTTEYKIQSTRPNFNDDIDQGKNVVDYVFVNDQIKVIDFMADQVAISDHLPLILEFAVK